MSLTLLKILALFMAFIILTDQGADDGAEGAQSGLYDASKKAAPERNHAAPGIAAGGAKRKRIY